MMQQLARAWPWSLVVIALIIIAIVLFLRAWLRAATRTEEDLELEELSEDVTTVDLTRSRSLAASFRWAVRLIDRYGRGRAARYRVPWFLLFGQTGSRPTDLMDHSGLYPAFEVPDDGEDESSGLTWSFFDHGVVLDLDGAYVLDADGRSADENGWQSFLKLLRHYRPERPLDGLILTLSCADLLAGDGVAARAALLAAKLRQLQNELAITLPIYVLVTGGEALAEFASFVRADAHRCGDVFGWSSPYRVDVAYRDAWVDEAFDRLHSDLQLAQIELLGGQPEDPDLADDVAVFPVALDAVREPLRGYLNGLFRGNAFQRGLIVRGIYFCAADQPALQPAAPAGTLLEPTTVVGRLCYLRDLLAAKIFPEYGLAEPESQTWLARSRMARTLQIAAVLTALVLTIGLWRANTTLDRRAGELQPFLEQVRDDLAETWRYRANGGYQQQEARANAQNLLGGLARIDFTRFGSFFLPSSWHGIDPLLRHFNPDLKRALIRSYDEIIFQEMSVELERRAASLGRTPGVPLPPRAETVAAASPPAVTAIEHMPTFLALETRVDELTLLEDNGDRYNRLPQSASLTEFGMVVEYLFNFATPADFFQNATLYHEALRRVTLKEFRPKDYKRPATTAVFDLAGRFDRALFEVSPLTVQLGALSSELAAAGKASRITAGAQIQALRRLLRRFDDVDFVLQQQEEINWAFGSEPDLGAEYQQTTAAMASSAFLGSTVAAQVRSNSETGWRSHQDRIADFGSTYTGPFLARENGRPLPRLSTETAQLREALRDFLDQSFMTLEGVRWFDVTIPAGTRLEWDRQRLEQANALVTPYQSFIETGLALFPTDLQPAVDDMARNQVAANMIDLVRRAQRFVPYQEPVSQSARERLIRLEVTSLSSAGAALNQLLENLQNLGVLEAYWDLADLLVAQGESILERLDTLLANDRLYQPRDGGFGWWDGTPPVVYPAFGVRDQPGLATYLSRQRTRIGQLATQYAGPTIEAVGSSRGADSPVYRRHADDWQAIIDQLEAFESKTPGSSVSVLEDLIAEEMPPVSPDDCRAGALEVASVDDFFLSQANVLGSELTTRCRLLAGERAAARYGELAQLFNQRLAGRFPFAPVSERTADPQADPADLRAFYALYDRHAASILAVPATHESFRGGGETVHAFLGRLGEVRDFFAFFLAEPQPSVVPRYDFDVVFRVDRNAERGGNQVIDWVLAVAAQTLRYPNGSGRWTLGDDLRLELRWAQDAPRLPFLAEPRRDVVVRDRTVVYQHGDPWSLLSFLLTHRGATPDPNPQTLVFEVDTRPSDTAAQGAAGTDQSPTRIYLRMRLKTPDEKNPQPVVLPACFPAAAPTLGTVPVTDGCVATAPPPPPPDAAPPPPPAAEPPPPESRVGLAPPFFRRVGLAPPRSTP